jgi:hypothetical protein
MLNAEMCAVLCYIGFFIENKVHVAGRKLQGRKRGIAAANPKKIISGAAGNRTPGLWIKYQRLH